MANIETELEPQFEDYKVCPIAASVPFWFFQAYQGHISDEEILRMIRNRVQIDALYHSLNDPNFEIDGHVPPGFFHSLGFKVISIPTSIT